jgi:hypothetical protein
VNEMARDGDTDPDPVAFVQAREQRRTDTDQR